MSSAPQRLQVAVIGSADCSRETAAVAETVGRELALRGATVICGGGGGVMEAACRGARSAGGHTIGLLPGSDGAAANPHLEFVIPTGLGHARNVIVALAGQAIIAIDGSYGTLSEIAFGLIYGTPVIGLNTWSVGIQDQPGRDHIVPARNPVEAVEKALAAVRERKPQPGVAPTAVPAIEAIAGNQRPQQGGPLTGTGSPEAEAPAGALRKAREKR